MQTPSPLDHRFLKKVYPTINKDLKKSKTPGIVNPSKSLVHRLETIKDRGKLGLLQKQIEKPGRYTITANQVPDSEVQLQRRLAREAGHGDVDISDTELKERIAQQQQESLHQWTRYLASPDALYDMTFKYFVLRSITKLDTAGSKRTKTTTKEFPVLNPAALAKVYEILLQPKTKDPSEKVVLDSELQDAKASNSFWKLYSYALKQVREAQAQLLMEQQEGAEGVWKKYPQGSDAVELSTAVQGTGWCTEGTATARDQLNAGDFYVYFTHDSKGIPTIPRIAIRMEGTRIAEVRGKGGGGNVQEVEAGLEDVVMKKLQEFPDGEQYQKKADNMKRMTEIEKMVNAGAELTLEQLRFLYEVDDMIEGFGMGRDPRIKEIRSKRNIKEDMTLVFGVPPDTISTTLEEALQGAIVHIASLSAQSLTSAQGLENLKYIGESAFFDNLTSAQGLDSLEKIGGDADFPMLTSAQGLENLKYIGESAFFNSLISAQGLSSLERIGHDARFDNLTSAQGLDSLEKIGGDARFERLTSAEGLENLKEIGFNAYFDSLTSAEGLENLKEIGFNARFDNLTSAQGLENLKYIGRDGYFSRLTSAQGLENLKYIGRDGYFDGLTSAQGLDSLEKIGGDAHFHMLTSAEGLENMKEIGGDGYFSMLTSAQGLENLKCIRGSVYFKNLTSAQGLENLKHIGGHAYFSKDMPEEERKKLQARFGIDKVSFV